MPVYKRRLKRGERWWFKFDYLNKTYSSKAIYLSAKEAKKAEAERLSTLEQQSRGIMTFRELCENRLDLIKTKSALYYKDHQKVLKPLVAEWGKLDIRQIDRLMITTHLTSLSQRLKNEGKDNYQANKTLRILKAMFLWALDQDLIDRNPVRVKIFPINKRKKYIPPLKDIKKVLEKCNPTQRNLIRFVRNTGARIGEALRATDKDFRNGKLNLWTRKNKRGDLQSRTIDYKPDFKIPEGRTFPEWNATPRFLAEACEAAGVKVFGWHALRHLKASELVRAGWDIVRVRDFLGHQDITTTNIYLQSLEGL